LDETVNRECVFEDYILPGCFLSLYASHSHEVSRFLLPHPSTMMFLGSYTLKNNGFIQPWCLVTGKNTLTKTDGTTFITQYPLLGDT
jgi:hypothetical protein